MNLEILAKVVEDMVLQHDYPGFEPRKLKLGLPDAVKEGPAKVFAEALGHENVFVKLAALRWFQESPGKGKGYVKAIAGLLHNQDPWVRVESIRCLERLLISDEEIILTIGKLLSDQDCEVKKAAAKAIGKICSKGELKPASVVSQLRAVCQDADPAVRWKAEKALRLIGQYDH